MTNDNHKCKHDHGDYWQSEKDGGYAKSFLKDCPFCKPVEPSVEEIADEVMKKIAFEIGRRTTGTNQNRIARAVIIEALRNERNRK